MLNPAELIKKWQRTLGLSSWKLRLRDEPPYAPAKNAALSETTYPLKESVLWISTEQDAIHELCHVLLAGLEDVYWRAERTKGLDALWKRREEAVVKRLERAFLRVGRKS